MSDLSSKKCLPCEIGTPPLDPSAIQKYQDQLSTKWEVIDNKKIKKEFEFKDFLEAMEFVNKVAKVAEEESHHPDIYIFYNKVNLELWTHAAHGLTENDFILASKINDLLS